MERTARSARAAPASACDARGRARPCSGAELVREACVRVKALEAGCGWICEQIGARSRAMRQFTHALADPNEPALPDSPAGPSELRRAEGPEGAVPHCLPGGAGAAAVRSRTGGARLACQGTGAGIPELGGAPCAVRAVDRKTLRVYSFRGRRRWLSKELTLGDIGASRHVLPALTFRSRAGAWYDFRSVARGLNPRLTVLGQSLWRLRKRADSPEKAYRLLSECLTV